uniref:Peptide-methionine (R)-S-oxide reductase n=1 Tax=Plectus sambesii TaxID=2011161 RepID=A0A914WQ34_9BILA
MMSAAHGSSEASGPAITKLGVDAADAKNVSEGDWKKVLSPEDYHVTREAGTEPPFANKYDRHFAAGDYNCHCCGVPLFDSTTKFHSGCGWPAFSASKDADANVVRIKDNSHGMERVEVRCKNCNAHLGHVFEDGPKPTGERYCINSCSILFEPQQK